MKTLANCTPREFLKQTNRIRKVAEKWLTDTKILEIRKRMPELSEPKKPSSKEEFAESVEERKAAFAEQARKNIFDMLDAMLEQYADETLELMALVCFIEPEEIDNHSMSEMFTAISEVMDDEGVVNFFGSLVRLGA